MERTPRSGVIDSLKPSETYTFAVAAITPLGDGPATVTARWLRSSQSSSRFAQDFYFQRREDPRRRSSPAHRLWGDTSTAAAPCAIRSVGSSERRGLGSS